MKQENVCFHLPGMDLDFLPFYTKLVEYMRLHQERFMSNMRIASFYGSFKNTIWSGGRPNVGQMPSPSEIENAVNAINALGISVCYTYTNCMLEEQHLYDTLCNRTMEIANNGKNGVLVNSPLLEKYLRQQYPNFKYIKSLTACERNIDKINADCEQYDLVVLDYRDNRNEPFLSKIRHKEKIKILADAYCPTSCTCSKQHYELVSQINLFQRNSDEERCLIRNTRKKQHGFYDVLENNTDSALTCDDIYKTYHDMGFNHFKLIGRNAPMFAPFESYMYYLVKPEFRDKVRSELADSYINCLIHFSLGIRKN